MGEVGGSGRRWTWAATCLPLVAAQLSPQGRPAPLMVPFPQHDLWPTRPIAAFVHIKNVHHFYFLGRPFVRPPSHSPTLIAKLSSGRASRVEAVFSLNLFVTK